MQVDIIALPDKVAEPVTPVAPKVAPKVELDTKPVVKPKVSPPKPDLKSAQQKALDKLNAMSAVEKIQKDLEREKQQKLAQQKLEELKKGNLITKGSDLAGLAKFQYDRYFQDLKQQIRANWLVPQFLSDANLQAEAKVIIDARGYVIGKEIIKSSGNDIYDNTVLAAIDKSSPLPTPPENLVGVLENEGVIFAFP